LKRKSETTKQQIYKYARTHTHTHTYTHTHTHTYVYFTGVRSNAFFSKAVLKRTVRLHSENTNVCKDPTLFHHALCGIS